MIGRAIALGLAQRNCSLILAVRDTTGIFLAMSDTVAGTSGRYSEERPCEWQGTPEANAALWRRCGELAAEVAGEGAEEG